MTAFPPAWCRPFVGIPYEQMDCWRLVRHVSRVHFGLDLPAYTDAVWTGREGAQVLGATIDGLKVGPGWLGVWERRSPMEQAPLDRFRPGDCLLMRIDGVPVHAGIVADDAWFLHTELASDSVVDELDGLRWRRRLLGAYRFEVTASDDPQKFGASGA